jgi:hypothetical protein
MDHQGTPDFIEIVDEPDQSHEEMNKGTPVVEPVEVEESPKKGMQQETVPILPPQRLFSRIEPQEKKYWHFKFSNPADGDILKQRIESVEGVTATYNYGGQKHPDVIIEHNGGIVGKIHFLHMDRRDRGIKSKYYAKIYFFEFTDSSMFEQIKDKVITFFHELRDRPLKRNSFRKSIKQTHKKKSKTRKHLSRRQ